MLDALRRFDSRGELVALARAGRRRLPGDSRYGDPLSLTGDDAPGVLGRGMTALGDARPSALREVGLSALQVWQSVAESRGRGHGDRDVAILFTDLVDFSSWVLDVGDDAAVDLLRRVGHAVEEPVRAEGGRVVKRLGDGVMAAFEDPAAAVRAACAASSEVGRVLRARATRRGTRRAPAPAGRGLLRRRRQRRGARGGGGRRR